jgi:hypothetical protein
MSPPVLPTKRIGMPEPVMKPGRLLIQVPGQ